MTPMAACEPVPAPQTSRSVQGRDGDACANRAVQTMISIARTPESRKESLLGSIPQLAAVLVIVEQIVVGLALLCGDRIWMWASVTMRVVSVLACTCRSAATMHTLHQQPRGHRAMHLRRMVVRPSGALLSLRSVSHLRWRCQVLWRCEQLAVMCLLPISRGERSSGWRSQSCATRGRCKQPAVKKSRLGKRQARKSTCICGRYFA